MNLPTFPKLSEDKMQQMLALPQGKMRVVIDTDAKNEIDDQLAIAWALLSQDQLEIEGMYAAPFSFRHHRQPLLDAYEGLDTNHTANESAIYATSYHDWAQRFKELGRDPYSIPFPNTAEGMELSYDEIVKLFELMGEDHAGKIFRGSTRYLKETGQPEQSAATDHLIERALADDDRPLYVVAIGAATNIANALLLEPKIVEHIVVLWTAAYPSSSNQCNEASLNLRQDLPASQLIFDSGVPHVYLPGFYVGEQLAISLPEMEEWVKGRGKIGDYLHEIYVNNPIRYQRGIEGHFGRTWIMWDLINIAWLLNPAWVRCQVVRAPILDENMYWKHDPNRHLMREAVAVSRDAIYRDFFEKLEKASQS